MAGILRDVQIFADLGEESLARLVGSFQEIPVAAGAEIFPEGAMADSLFVVLSGRIEILKKTDKGERSLAVLGQGEFFGEMGVFKGEPRVASARAVAESVLLRIGRDDLLALVKEHPLVGMRIRNEIVRRHTANIAKLLG